MVKNFFTMMIGKIEITFLNPFNIVLFFFQVVYALLMPAGAPLADDSSDFQFHFLKSGGLPLVLSMLTRNNFLPNAVMETSRGAYLNALNIAKLLLTAIGYGHVRAVAEACQPGVEGVNPMTSVIDFLKMSYL